MLYVANITVMVGFISLIFLNTYYWVIMLYFSSTKIRNSFVESLFFKKGAIDEPKDNSRVKLIVETDIG